MKQECSRLSTVQFAWEKYRSFLLLSVASLLPSLSDEGTGEIPSVCHILESSGKRCSCHIVKLPRERLVPFAQSNPVGPVVSSGQHSIHFLSLYPMGTKDLAHFLSFWPQPSALPPGFPACCTITVQPLLQFSTTERTFESFELFSGIPANKTKT